LIKACQGISSCGSASPVEPLQKGNASIGDAKPRRNGVTSTIERTKHYVAEQSPFIFREVWQNAELQVSFALDLYPTSSSTHSNRLL